MERVTACEPQVRRPRSEWVEIGRVVRPHGVRGGLNVALYGDDPANLLHASRVRLAGRAGTVELEVVSASSSGTSRDGGARARVRLAGVEDRDVAAVWAGATLSIPEASLQPLEEGEFYWRDVLGLVCRTRDGRDLGTVEEILPTPLNDVLVVREGDRTLLVPALRHVLVSVDVEAGTLWIDPPEGMLEGLP